MTDTANRNVDAAQSLLRRIARDHAPAACASSLGAEDMVLTDLIFRNDLPIEVFTLDTGRLPEDTYSLLDAIAGHYGQRLRVVFPRLESVEAYVNVHGVNGFYGSVELRKGCCHIRKVEPLRRALSGKRAWITGLRRDQSETRSGIAVESFDADNGLMKFSPLAEWSHQDVWEYLREHGVPYNALYDRGYSSIGCAPCTRAVAAGEESRAGRWWWENPESKECGLHVSPDGKTVRAREPA